MPFLNWGSVVAVVMAVVWLFRYSSKGRRAIVMALAFFDFASVVQLIKVSAPAWAIVALFIVLAFLLLLDMGLRSAEKEESEQ